MNISFAKYILAKENNQSPAVPLQTLDTKSSNVKTDTKYPALSQQMPQSQVPQNYSTGTNIQDKLQEEHIKKTFSTHISKAFEELSKSNISPEKAKNLLGTVVQEMMKTTGLNQTQAKTVVDKLK